MAAIVFASIAIPGKVEQKKSYTAKMIIHLWNLFPLQHQAQLQGPVGCDSEVFRANSPKPGGRGAISFCGMVMPVHGNPSIMSVKIRKGLIRLITTPWGLLMESSSPERTG